MEQLDGSPRGVTRERAESPSGLVTWPSRVASEGRHARRTNKPRTALGATSHACMRAIPLVLSSRALDLWRTAVGQMSWERRAEAAIALLVVRDDEL